MMNNTHVMSQPCINSQHFTPDELQGGKFFSDLMSSLRLISYKTYYIIMFNHHNIISQSNRFVTVQQKGGIFLHE